MRVRNRKLATLIPQPLNVKKHPETQIARIASFIREYGFLVPVVIDKEDNILAGHGRVQAAQLLGMDAVPCVSADELTPAQAKAFTVAENRAGEGAEWDMPNLKLTLDGLQEMDFPMDMTGFESFEIEDMFTEKEESHGKEGTPIVSYTLVFEDESRQALFHRALRSLKQSHPGETHAERLVLFLEKALED